MPAEKTVANTQRIFATKRGYYQTVKHSGIADLARATDGRVGQFPGRFRIGGDVSE
jgi:hypothetical protein